MTTAKQLLKRIICSLKGHNYYTYATNLPHIETLYKCKNYGKLITLNSDKK